MKAITKITIASALLGALLLAGACDDLQLKGRQITFTTVSGEVSTKTAYGTDYPESGTTTHQYIDWVVGDNIRIVSDNATTSNGAHYADYIINELAGREAHKSYGKIAPTPNGLTWAEAHQTYAFYAVYPKPGIGGVDAIISPEDATAEDMFGTVRVILPSTPALPAASSTKTVTADGVTYTYDVYAPDMNYAVMTASALDVDKSSENQVSLLFKPAFTAFEFNLTSADKTFTVTKVELCADASANDYLAGKYVFKAGADLAVSGNVRMSGTGNSKSVALTMGSGGKAVTPENGFTVTLFTVPIVNTGLLSLKVYTADGGIATLPLTDTDKSSPYKFLPGKKYRVNLLKLGKPNVWKLTIQTEVQDWTFYSKELSSLDQINVAPIEIGQPGTVKVTGAIQTTAEWKSAHGGSSNDEIAANGYARYYQVRTLNWNLPVDKQFIELSFTPTAPIGGYWQMIPEFLGTNSDKHFSFKVKIQGVSDWEDQEAPHGQILSSKKVFIRIYPKDYAQDDINVYEMILKCYFSPNASFDPTYSADSELQDIHGDGRFSYWRFRLDKATGSGTYTPGTPEHDSDKL